MIPSIVSLIRCCISHFSRILFAFVALLLAFSVCQAEEPLRVLAIGNSFTDNATTYLAQVASSEGRNILIGRAIMRGSSFERHVGAIQAFEADPGDPAGSPYSSYFTPSRKGPGKYSLQGLLTAEKWDVVTIQQVSNLSYKAESFEPFVGTLIGYIRRFAPQAEILIHQTWAYREDYPGFGLDGLTQEKMYEGLVSAYGDLAAKYDLGIIPVGSAFQIARQSERWRFRFPDADFDYKEPGAETLPSQVGSLNKGWHWVKSKSGKLHLKLDFRHANDSGKYLAGLVWYQTLFGEPLSDRTFVPDCINVDVAADLRAFAKEAVERLKPGIDGSGSIQAQPGH